MPEKTRNNYIDALKGAAIILVVIGHSIQYSTNNFDDNALFRAIYSFHMPLFMFLSGYVAFYSNNLRKGFVWQKALMLVVPFIAWYAIAYVVKGAYHTEGIVEYGRLLYIGPDQGLWFLWVLFLNLCALHVAVRLEKWLHMVSFALVWLAIFTVPFKAAGVGFMKWYFGFFLLGYLINRYYERLRPVLKISSLAATLVFPFLALSWYRLHDPSFTPFLAGHLAIHGLSFLLAPLLYLYKIIVPLSGIGFMFYIFKKLHGGRLANVCAWLGVYTLDLYVSHQLLIAYVPGQGASRMVMNFIVALVGSLALSFLVLRRHHLSHRVLLGGRAHKGQKASLPAEFHDWSNQLSAWGRSQWLAFRKV